MKKWTFHRIIVDRPRLVLEDDSFFLAFFFNPINSLPFIRIIKTAVVPEYKDVPRNWTVG